MERFCQLTARAWLIEHGKQFYSNWFNEGFYLAHLIQHKIFHSHYNVKINFIVKNNFINVKHQLPFFTKCVGDICLFKPFNMDRIPLVGELICEEVAFQASI